MGLGAEIAAIVAERALDDLRAPVQRLTVPDVAGIPASGPMEDYLIPDRGRIAVTLRSLARVDRGQRAHVAVNGRVPEGSWSQTAMTAATEIPQASSVIEVEL